MAALQALRKSGSKLVLRVSRTTTPDQFQSAPHNSNGSGAGGGGGGHHLDLEYSSAKKSRLRKQLDTGAAGASNVSTTSPTAMQRATPGPVVYFPGAPSPTAALVRSPTATAVASPLATASATATAAGSSSPTSLALSDEFSESLAGVMADKAMDVILPSTSEQQASAVVTSIFQLLDPTAANANAAAAVGVVSKPPIVHAPVSAAEIRFVSEEVFGSALNSKSATPAEPRSPRHQQLQQPHPQALAQPQRFVLSADPVLNRTATALADRLAQRPDVQAAAAEEFRKLSDSWTSLDGSDLKRDLATPPLTAATLASFQMIQHADAPAAAAAAAAAAVPGDGQLLMPPTLARDHSGSEQNLSDCDELASDASDEPGAAIAAVSAAATNPATAAATPGRATPKVLERSEQPGAAAAAAPMADSLTTSAVSAAPGAASLWQSQPGAPALTPPAPVVVAAPAVAADIKVSASLSTPSRARSQPVAPRTARKAQPKESGARGVLGSVLGLLQKVAVTLFRMNQPPEDAWAPLNASKPKTKPTPKSAGAAAVASAAPVAVAVPAVAPTLAVAAAAPTPAPTPAARARESEAERAKRRAERAATHEKITRLALAGASVVVFLALVRRAAPTLFTRLLAVLF